MEEIISLIYLGCKLARDLELNLQHLANQPKTISSSCDEIIKTFINIKQLLDTSVQDRSSTNDSMFPAIQQQIDEGVEAWLRSNYARVVDNVVEMTRTSNVGEKSTVDHLTGLAGTGSGNRPITNIDQQLPQSVDALMADQGKGLSLHRQRRPRAGNVERRTMLVAAPRMGNTEVPPDDGFTWRKYGQKEILGSAFPRGYYRCTHQKMYQCPAKKQVQRLDHDPYTFEVTYRGDHTCTMSSTAPSTAPHPPQITATSPEMPIGTWLAMELRPPSRSREELNQFMDAHAQVHTRPEFNNDNIGAGPSRIRFGGQVDYNQLPVVDMADVMFNSGSSSNNSMDLIFASNDTEHKWDLGDKK